MQIILNGQSYRPSSLGREAVWLLVETLERTAGWRRVSATATTVCLVK